MALTREAFLSALPTVKIEPVQLLNGTMAYVRTPTQAGYGWYSYESFIAKDGAALMFARMLCITVCDEAGKLLFTHADAEALGEVSADQRLLEAAQRMLPDKQSADDDAKN